MKRPLLPSVPTSSSEHIYFAYAIELHLYTRFHYAFMKSSMTKYICYISIIVFKYIIIIFVQYPISLINIHLIAKSHVDFKHRPTIPLKTPQRIDRKQCDQ